MKLSQNRKDHLWRWDHCPENHCSMLCKNSRWEGGYASGEESNDKVTLSGLFRFSSYTDYSKNFGYVLVYSSVSGQNNNYFWEIIHVNNIDNTCKMPAYNKDFCSRNEY